MGRDVTGLRSVKKPNAKPNVPTRDRVHVAPKISNGKSELEEKVVEDHEAKVAVNEGSQEMQDVLTAKSTNTEADSPGAKPNAESFKPTEKKLSSPVKLSLETDAKGSSQSSPKILQASEVSTETRVPSTSIAAEVEITDAAVSKSKMNEMHTPVTARRSMMNEMHTPMTARRSQPHSLLMSGKHLLSDSKKYHDDEDTFSIASSVATSVRTLRSKITVPMEPTFKSSERLARRKEYYTKLEEKHKALEAEKLEYVSRSKEEEEAAIKQLRKVMTYKANPVPNFYREGPPPKAELKKLPVTRAKSPNFTRRKSCGDAIKPSPEEKKSAARPTRHSIGVLKNGIAYPPTPKTKDLSTTRNVRGPSKLKDSNGSSKTKARPKQVKETAITPQPESKKVSPDSPVVETITSHLSEQSTDPVIAEDGRNNAEAIPSHLSERSPDAVVVEDKRNNAEAEVIEGINMNSQTLIEA